MSSNILTTYRNERKMVGEKMWIIYQINKKTKIPKKHSEGNDDKLIETIKKLQNNKEYIWAVRFNIDKPNE